jgi:hypothetical protein
MNKKIFTLQLHGHNKKVQQVTRPALEKYAARYGYEIEDITSRQFPEWPITFEKFQVYERMKGLDWALYIDTDALIHPNQIDFTEVISKDSVCFSGKDFAPQRWTYDNYFRRDGRHLGCCSWFVLCSDWTRDLWNPVQDISLSNIIDNINPIVAELNYAKYVGETPKEYASHLIDDYLLSRNVARYGLKYESFRDWDHLPINPINLMAHIYLDDEETKFQHLTDVWEKWSNESGSVFKGGK